MLHLLGWGYLCDGSRACLCSFFSRSHAFFTLAILMMQAWPDASLSLEEAFDGMPVDIDARFRKSIYNPGFAPMRSNR